MKAKNILWVITALLLIMVVAGCTNKNANKDNNKVRITTSLNFYGEAAKRVVGKQGTVSIIINSDSVNPHEYEPSVTDAKKVTGSNIVVYNGLGYDEWMPKLANGAEPGLKEIDVGKDLLHLKRGANEHLWYDYHSMMKLTDQIAKYASEIDPKHKDYFEANAKKYKQDLEKIPALETEIKQAAVNKKVATTEPVFNYPLEEMGFVITDKQMANDVEENIDPSLSDINRLTNQLNKNELSFMIVNSQVDNRFFNSIFEHSKESKTPKVKVSETMPSNTNYIDWFTGELNQIKTIVQEQRHD